MEISYDEFEMSNIVPVLYSSQLNNVKSVETTKIDKPSVRQRVVDDRSVNETSVKVEISMAYSKTIDRLALRLHIAWIVVSWPCWVRIRAPVIFTF